MSGLRDDRSGLDRAEQALAAILEILKDASVDNVYQAQDLMDDIEGVARGYFIDELSQDTHEFY